MKDKAIDADLLVSGDTDFLYEALFISQGAQCGEQPAITVSALSNIIRSSALDEELWAVENIGDSLDRSRAEANIWVVFRGGCKHPEAILLGPPSFQINLKVKVFIGIFLVNSSAFLDNFVHLLSANICCFFVG
jgi:hypothetical protein